jgi:anti-sigma B factor antagonist
MFEIHRKHIDPDVFVIQPVGRITMGRACQEVDWLVDELIRGNIRKLVIDLTGVERVDSTGIGIIVTGSGKIKKAGGEIRLCGVKGMVYDMMHTANIHRIIPFYDTIEEAVASFSAPAKQP